MAQPAPEAGTDGKLVWAPDEVAARIRQEVTPEPSLPSRVALAVLAAFVLTWPPTFVVFALATLVAPAATDEAGVGRVALWALQFAGLTRGGGGAALRRSTEAEVDPSPRRIALRIAGQTLVTVACAGLVLALAGLSVGQYAMLTAALVVVLHLLPMTVARLLFRLRRRRSASPSA